MLATNPNADLYGASRMFLEAVTGLRGRGWEVAWVVAEKSGPLRARLGALGAQEHTARDAVLRKVALRGFGAVGFAVSALRALGSELRLLRRLRPDVVYVNTVTEPLWIVVARIARVPVVCHVHEAEASMSRVLRRLLYLPLFGATRIVANSEFAASVLTDSWRRLGLRCTTIRNGVEGPPAVVPPREALEPPLRLCYVGRLSERKGVSDAVDAVRLLVGRGVDVELEILGDVYPGREEVKRRLRDQVAGAGLDARVRFSGFRAEVWPHLERADVVLVPSRVDEPFGNTAVEAILAARPVVVSGVGGLREAVAGMRSAVVVPPSSPAAIADAVERLAARWAELREVALDEAAQARRRHDPAGYRQAVVDVVDTLWRTRR